MIPRQSPDDSPPQDVEMAVHTYFQALRALGRTKVSASEVAAALNISEGAVVHAANSLTAKGVKLLG
jgi:biotin operon repressor